MFMSGLTTNLNKFVFEGCEVCRTKEANGKYNRIAIVLLRFN